MNNPFPETHQRFSVYEVIFTRGAGCSASGGYIFPFPKILILQNDIYKNVSHTHTHTHRRATSAELFRIRSSRDLAFSLNALQLPVESESYEPIKLSFPSSPLSLPPPPPLALYLSLNHKHVTLFFNNEKNQAVCVLIFCRF